MQAADQLGDAHPIRHRVVVTPNKASTESGATLTVGRSAFSESGAPTMNGSHATAATATARTGRAKVPAVVSPRSAAGR